MIPVTADSPVYMETFNAQAAEDAILRMTFEGSLIPFAGQFKWVTSEKEVTNQVIFVQQRDSPFSFDYPVKLEQGDNLAVFRYEPAREDQRGPGNILYPGYSVGLELISNSTPEPEPPTTPTPPAEGLPYGIPEPEWGISEIPPPYDQNNPLHYWVDNTHPEATNDDVNGTPDQPRMVIPWGLPPGAVCYISGGPYTYSFGGIQPIGGQGTAEEPVWYVGQGMPRLQVRCAMREVDASSWVQLYALDMAAVTIIGPSHHISVRSVLGRSNNTCIQIYGTEGKWADHVTVYESVLSDCGLNDDFNWDERPDEDIDRHGMKVDAYSSRVWVLNSEGERNYGNFVQFGNHNNSYQHIDGMYIGGNTVKPCRQSCMGIKQASNIIISQNVLNPGHMVQADNLKAGMVYQYGPENLEFIYNEVYGGDLGIKGGSYTNAAPSGENVLILGNYIHDCRVEGEYNSNSSWSAAGIMTPGGAKLRILDNTIMRCDAGINLPIQYGNHQVWNNVIGEVGRGHSIFVEFPYQADVEVSHCGFDRTMRLRWGSTVMDTLIGAPVRNCVHTADLMLDGDVAREGSPLIDAGRLSGAEVDRVGQPRVVGWAQDIGSREK